MSQCPHLNILDPGLYRGGAPHQEIARQRHIEPVYWLDNDALVGEGVWVVTTRAELDHVAKNPQLFSSRENTCVIHEKGTGVDLDMMRLQMINMDPPEHIKFRRVVRSVFTPSAVDAYEPRLRAIVKDTIDRVCERGECEFVADVAAPLPLATICEFLGVPERDYAQISEWLDIALSGGDPELGYTAEDRANAGLQIYMYAHKRQEHFRKEPTDNLLSQLIAGEVDGVSLTPEEVNSFCVLLFSGGLETTRTVSSHGMRLLLEHPDQMRYLQDNPERIPDFVEEVLRYNAAINFMIRTATGDTTLGGKEIKKGQLVMMLYHGANHDESIFAEPGRFDITRPQREDVRNNHRAFGIGQHFCIGSHLARLQLLVLFEEILSRLQNPRLTGEMTWLQSYFLNAIKSMPMAFDAAGPSPEP
ncbi:MAG: cytochrome P450 [Halieaceae bacterium]|nr:cytochrome P450 [Halieaceae bacterium]